jgi:hypothetical protein
MTYREFIEYSDSDKEFIIHLSKNPVTSMYDSVFIRYKGNEYGMSYPISAFSEFKAIASFCEERKKELIHLYKRQNTKIGSLMLAKNKDE